MTDKQFALIVKLLDELDKDIVVSELNELTKQEASEFIQELIDEKMIRSGIKGE